MTVGFKRLGIAVVAVVAGSLIALVLASYLISADAARDAVVAEVRAATGLQPVLRGPVSISMFPSATVTLSDVALGAGEDGEAPFAVRNLTAHLRLLPLITGQIEIADVTLVEPHITLAFDTQGRSNWSPLIDTLALALKPSTNRADHVLSFSEIRIANGTIVLRDAARKLDETLTHVELSLAWPAIAKSFAATGRVTWHDDPLDVSVTVSDFPAALAGDNTGLKLRASGTFLKVAFDGAMGYRPSLKVDGTLAADAASLRETMQWIGEKRLPGSGLGRFAVKARTGLVGGTVVLSNLNIELDGNAAEGVLGYSFSGRHLLQGTLAVDGLDLTPYAAAARLTTDNSRAWNARPLALDWFNDVDFDLRLSAAKVTAGSTKFGRTAVAATLRGGRLVVTIGESQAFNGVIKGSFTIGKSEEGAQLRSQMQFADVDLDSCLAEFLSIRRLEGKGNLFFSIEGSGPSIMALTRTLGGTASLTAQQGALAGFNVEQLLRRLERRPLSGSGDFRTGRTPFDQLTVSLRIAQGLASVEEVRMEGGAVRLALEGSASIPARELELTGTASLLTAAETPPTFALPFVVQGTWDDPIILPDTQALLRRSGAAAPLLDAVTDKRARDAVRSAIERLTGALRPLGAPAVPDPGSASALPAAAPAGR